MSGVFTSEIGSKMRDTRKWAIGKQDSFRREDAKFGHVCLTVPSGKTGRAIL